MHISFSDAVKLLSQGEPYLTEDKILSALVNKPVCDLCLRLFGRSL